MTTTSIFATNKAFICGGRSNSKPCKAITAVQATLQDLNQLDPDATYRRFSKFCKECLPYRVDAEQLSHTKPIIDSDPEDEPKVIDLTDDLPKMLVTEKDGVLSTDSDIDTSGSPQQILNQVAKHTISAYYNDRDGTLIEAESAVAAYQEDKVAFFRIQTDFALGVMSERNNEARVKAMQTRADAEILGAKADIIRSLEALPIHARQAYVDKIFDQIQ